MKFEEKENELLQVQVHVQNTEIEPKTQYVQKIDDDLWVVLPVGRFRNGEKRIQVKMQIIFQVGLLFNETWKVDLPLEVQDSRWAAIDHVSDLKYELVE